MNHTLTKVGKQYLLQQAFENPELFRFELQGRDVLIVPDNSVPIKIDELNTEVPSVALPLLKIKSWRLDKNNDSSLSLRLKLIL